MELANDMIRTKENIVASHKTRVETIDNLADGTRNTLRGFALDRKKTAREQSEALTHFKEELSKTVKERLKDFQEGHKQMSQEQAKSLTDFIKRLTSDVSSMVSGFRKDRARMSSELEARLSREVKEIGSYMERKLKEYHEAHVGMTAQQKKDLATFLVGMRAEVRRLLAGYRKDIDNASQTWKGMTRFLARARTGGPVRIGAEAGGGMTPGDESGEEINGKEIKSIKKTGKPKERSI